MFSLFIDLPKDEWLADVHDLDWESSIKFGGYDKNGVAEGAEFHLLDSVEEGMWSFEVEKPIIAGKALPFYAKDEIGRNPGAFMSLAQFNPAFPWIYLNEDDFASLYLAFDEELACDMTYGECRFESDCETLLKSGQDFSFSIEVNGVLITVPSDEMLIPGSKLNDREKDKVCFLAVFRNPQMENDELKPKYYLLGTLVMKRFYFVFDANESTLRLGFG